MKACALFEDSVNGFLVMAETPGEFEPASVRAAVTRAGRELEDAVDAAPGDLAVDMRDARDAVQLYSAAMATEADSKDQAGQLMFVSLHDAQDACVEAGVEVDFPPSFNGDR